MDLLNLVLQKDVLLWVVLGTIAVIWIVCATVTSMVKVLSRERTRREIAAYIAEGSLTPEQGERLMKAEEKASCGG